MRRLVLIALLALGISGVAMAAPRPAKNIQIGPGTVNYWSNYCVPPNRGPRVCPF